MLRIRHNLKISEKIIEPPFTILKPEISEKEFFEFATEDISCELIEGMLVIHSPASLEHENIFQFLLVFLNQFLKKKNLGKVIGSRFVMRLGPRLIFEPDLIILLQQSISKLKPTFLDGPSEFLIEILSPSTKETDLSKKVPHYLEKGVKEIWAIDPMIRELTVFSSGKKPKKYTKNEIVKSIVLSGLWINLKWLWDPEKFDPLDCLNVILKDY